MDIKTSFLIIGSLFCFGCHNDSHTGKSKQTIIVYMAADNNIAEDALNSIEEMKDTYPTSGNKDLIVFVDFPDEMPYFMKIDPKSEMKIKDYDEFNSANATRMQQVLTDIVHMYPSDSYGLILWSHGSSWIPAGYSAQAFGWDNGQQMDITDLSAALPLKFDYILFDACLMGSVEVAYELRHKANHLIASSTETLYTGFPYHSILPDLLSDKPNLTTIAEKYIHYYQNLSGIYQSASISVVDLNEMENLAATNQQIINNSTLSAFNITEIQHLDMYNKPLIFDYLDFIKHAYPHADMADLEKQLNKTVLYKSHTDTFMGKYNINTYSGLGCHIPNLENEQLNEFYQTLDWCSDSGFSSFFNTLP